MGYELPCVNSLLLAKHEKEIDMAEKAFEAFESELVNDLGLYNEYEELEAKFDAVCERYGYTDKTFHEWLGEQ